MSEDEPLGYVAREAIAPVDWDAGGKVHNWRNHVGSRIRAIWDSLPDDLKIVVALDADDRAGYEEWE